MEYYVSLWLFFRPIKPLISCEFEYFINFLSVLFVLFQRINKRYSTLQCLSIQTKIIMNLEVIKSEGVKIITEDDKNRIQGSLRLRIRARFSLFKRRISNKFKRRDYIIEKVQVNVQRINGALSKLNFECSNGEVISDNQTQISLIRYELAEISTCINKAISIQIE